VTEENQDHVGMTDVEQRFEQAIDGAPAHPRPVRWNTVRDVVAALLLLLALAVPWNVSFGLGMPNRMWWLFAVVVGATLLALVALAASHGGPLAASESIDKARLGLTAFYLLVVLGFVGFAIFDFAYLSGGGATAPGIGPGAMVGAAGAFLAAQPVLRGDDGEGRRFVGWFVFASRIASWAKFLVVVSVVVNLFVRMRDVLPNVFDAGVAGASIAAILTAVAYAIVAATAVWIGLRWLQQEELAAGIATVALGAATLVGTLLVWFLGVGRDVDAFHGIAQATSTAGVGYEGYLPWAAAAAIFAPMVLRRAFTKPIDPTVWQHAMRKCLLLIVVWCGGSAVLRIVDVIAQVASGVPFSPSDSVVLFLFDAATAGFAYWFRSNVGTASQHPAVLSRLSGVLFVLLACRLIVGIGLSRSIMYAAPPDGFDHSVYGNALEHQLTSTFDVVLCVLSLAVVAIAVFVLRGVQRRSDEPGAGAAPAPAPQAPDEWDPTAPLADDSSVGPEEEVEPKEQVEPKAEVEADEGRHRHRRQPTPEEDSELNQSSSLA